MMKGRHKGPAPQAGCAQAFFFAGCRLAAVAGWRSVERLIPGEALRSVNGTVRLTGIRARRDCTALAPVLIPAGTLGNREPAFVMPEMPVRCGTALIAARDLNGHFGISRPPPAEGARLMQLELETPALLQLAHGLVVAAGQSRLLPVLSGSTARHHLLLAQAEALGTALQATSHDMAF